MASAAETFLADFHAKYTGATSAALGALPVRCQEALFANSYELVVAHIPRRARRIADVACGDGFLLSRILAAGFRDLTGVDMSEAELARASQALGDQATLIRCKAQDLPLRDRSFDAVTSHMALMLMEEPGRVLAQIHRILREDGMLIAVVGGAFPVSQPLDTYRALIGPHIASSSSRVAIGDPRWRTAEGITRLLDEAQFRDAAIVDVEANLVMTPASLWDWFMLMYDAHFVDERTRQSLRVQFLDSFGAQAAASPATLDLPVRWMLVLAER